MIKSYLDILKDSLEKKFDILVMLEQKSLEQYEMLREEDVDLDFIDSNMEEKDKLIKKISSLDDGFDALYVRIRHELENKKELYKSEIEELKLLITRIMEKSSSIQAIELRNKNIIDNFFFCKKKELQSRKNAMSVARDYYQNMNKIKNVSPQFLDQKK